jgi:hypothetical protein
MRLTSGGGDRELRILFHEGLMQTRDEVARQERAIRRAPAT